MKKNSVLLFILIGMVLISRPVLAEADNGNLLLNTSVEYSGVEGGRMGENWAHPDFIGEKAVDGDPKSRWSAAKEDIQWLVSDLGRVKKVGEVVIQFHAESPSYEVLVSRDGQKYERIFFTDTGSQGGTVIKKIQFEAKDVRYIKYQQNCQWVHANGKRYGSSIYELEAYAEASSQPESALFQKLLKNRKIALTGKKDNDPIILKIVEDKDSEIRNSEKSGIWDQMVKNSNDILWEDKSDWKTNSANLKLMTDNIQKMAIQYNTPNSIWYKNEELKQDILYAVDWYYQNGYNERITNRYGNWFHWEVSIPKNLGNIYILMKDEISEVVMSKYLLTIDRFIPDPAKRLSGMKETGANLLDKCFAVLSRSLIDQDRERYTIAMSSSLSVYKYVTSGDGFYEDGSFIQHNNVPYTGGYGAEVLGRVGDMIGMFLGTDALSEYPEVFKMFELIESTYKVTLIDGQSMSLTRGRRPSRSTTDDFTEGRDMLFYIYAISTLNSNELQKNDIFWFIKNQIICSEKGDDFYANWDINKIQSMQNLMENVEIPEDSYVYDSNRNMGMMTQMFHRKQSFSSAVSMFSKNTTAFEYVNKENKQGFYTGTGMYYLYNGDKRHYLDGYWGTVDMVRLPGTTTDGKVGTLINDGSWLNTKSWSGGISNGSVGSASMHYTMEKVTKSTLEAKKSWFMLDNQVVAVGAGIKSSSLGDVESIIENRKVTSYPLAKLYVDGVEIPFGVTLEFTNPKWAYLDTGEIDSSIGYVFKENSGIIKAEYKEEVKNWQVVNETNPSQIVRNRFMILSAQHGEMPQDEEYQYAVLPNISLSQLREEVMNPSVMILANTKEQQVIKKSDGSLYLGNFQEIGTIGQATAKTRGSILIHKAQGLYEICLSDPMRMNQKVEFSVTLEKGLKIDSMDPEITASNNGGLWTISMNTTLKNGQSKKVTLIREKLD